MKIPYSLGWLMEWGMYHITLSLGFWSILGQEKIIPIFKVWKSRQVIASNFVNLEMTTNPLKYNVN